uniref:Protein ninG n=1 Tax=uncultured marine virus TaxID=186617 RepID=A0A0F7L8U3_9VIRU|nr:hypothetical protein SARI_02660 [uncultured marine virus]
MKIKIDKIDSLFSKMIRERDKWRCIFCGNVYEPPTSALHNSHFWGRGHKSTRYDARNCDALCYGCHVRNEGNKQGYYRDFKIEQLGRRVYNSLEKKARGIVQFGEYEKKQTYEALKKTYEKGGHLKKGWKGV